MSGQRGLLDGGGVVIGASPRIYRVRRTENRCLPAEERGAVPAISDNGYRLGMLVSGGLALWLADRWLGWQGMYWLMAALAITCSHLTGAGTDRYYPVPKSLEQAVSSQRRYAILLTANNAADFTAHCGI